MRSALKVILFLSFFDNIFTSVDTSCTLSTHIKDEIASYTPIANRIIKEIVYGKYSGKAWRSLAKFTDKFGNRISGSKNLEDSIDYMVDVLKSEKLENVHTETAVVPHWVRGVEKAVMLEPRRHTLNILGLGSSIGTKKYGVLAPVLVVDSFQDLRKMASKVPGKIVVFNEKFVSYGETVKYRDYSASEAAKLGAVAALVRSVTPFSINSPHTGWQDYEKNVTKIPVACITIEDSEMMARMQERGKNITVYLFMGAKNHPPVKSRNTVAEIKGHQFPSSIVLVSGHLDSWDVGEGAMDDGGGAFISWNSLSILHQLGLRPRRTLRSVLWTGEEEGLWGARAYFNSHKNNLSNFNLVMESDEGTFHPRGISFSGSNKAGCIIREVLKLLAPINATSFVESGEPGPDIIYFTKAGVPSAGLLNDNQRYFWFHHSDGDTMTVEDLHNLDLCTAVWSVVSFVVADLIDNLPRTFT